MCLGRVTWPGLLAGWVVPLSVADLLGWPPAACGLQTHALLAAAVGSAGINR